MFRTLAPDPVADTRALPLRLEATRSLRFEPGPPTSDPQLERYFGDMLAPYGGDGEPVPLGGLRPVSHTSMAERILAAVPPGPFSHVVLACATPDVDCWSSVGCRLTELAEGSPHAFCVSDQGPIAPFTALRLAGELLRAAPEHGRAMLLLLDQATVPWPVDDPELTPAVDAAVAYVFAASPGAPAVSVRQESAVAPDRVPAVIAGHLRAAGPATLVAGREVPLTPAVRDLAVRVHEVPPGRVCTAVWAVPHERRTPGPVVLAEYDAELRSLSVATIEDPAW